MNKEKIIDKIIKELEKIKNDENIDVTITPWQEVESYEFYDGKIYVLLATNIEIKHNKLFEKGQWYDDFTYRLLDGE